MNTAACIVCEREMLEYREYLDEPAEIHLGTVQTFAVRIQIPVLTGDYDAIIDPGEPSSLTVAQMLRRTVAQIYGEPVALVFDRALDYARGYDREMADKSQVGKLGWTP